MTKPGAMDIVERLRTDRNGRVYCDALVNEAADEIERLRRYEAAYKQLRDGEAENHQWLDKEPDVP
jgi:hypothetical protein